MEYIENYLDDLIEQDEELLEDEDDPKEIDFDDGNFVPPPEFFPEEE